MSTEEAELTFIRCPSCRSLVPAVASRCRMCGHNFAEAKRETEPVIDKSPMVGIASDVPSSTRSTEIDLPRIPRLKESIAISQIVPNESSIEEVPRSAAGSAVEAKEEQVFKPLTQGSEELEQRKRKRRKRKRRPGIQTESVETLVESNLNRETRMDNYSSDIKAEPFERIPNRNGALPQQHPRVEREGVLVGWLVNYAANQAGISQEIRSGQFFIGRQRLRDTDLLVQDETISTPHLLVRAGDKGGIVVQDLLSEEGTFVRRAGDSDFVKCEEITKLEHGDTLRIGRYEVLVCLLPKR